MPALLILSILILTLTAHAEEKSSISILYYEPVQLIETKLSSKKTTVLATADNYEPFIFDAFGRHFELQPVESRPLHNPEITQLRGYLVGLPGSWFSLLQDGEEMSGIIADGIDTYLIEPHRRMTGLLVEIPAEHAPPNLIFRLADILVPQGLMACPSQSDTMQSDGYIDGQSALTKLNAELQSVTSNATFSGNPRLQVGVVADTDFVNTHAAETENEITAIFNIVQGMYTNQVGIDIEVASIFSVTPDISNPFSATSIAQNLLKELSDWRIINQADLGHTHLITDRNLKSDTGEPLAGISFLGHPGRSGICNPATGASLSSDTPSLTALIVVHEIGHSLGAPHDGDPDGACASTPDMEFIMSPSISPATAMEFSSCSITQMDKVIAAASCLSTTDSTFPVDAGNGGSASSSGGGGLGWISIAGLLLSLSHRKRRLRLRP